MWSPLRHTLVKILAGSSMLLTKVSRPRISEVLIVFVAASISAFSGGVSSQVLLEVQKALIGFAGLVVTIFGIWIAVIFPVLSGLLADGKAKQEVSELTRYDTLVRALYRACFALTACFLVFLVLSFSSYFDVWVARSSVFFSWLAFSSTAWALWSAVWNGESAVVGGVNVSVRKGLIRRVRSLGRTVPPK